MSEQEERRWAGAAGLGVAVCHGNGRGGWWLQRATIRKGLEDEAVPVVQWVHFEGESVWLAERAAASGGWAQAGNRLG